MPLRYPRILPADPKRDEESDEPPQGPENLKPRARNRRTTVSVACDTCRTKKIRVCLPKILV